MAEERLTFYIRRRFTHDGVTYEPGKVEASQEVLFAARTANVIAPPPAEGEKPAPKPKSQPKGGE
jgi:hypothetical protein